jgi:hypothetical protein
VPGGSQGVCWVEEAQLLVGQTSAAEPVASRLRKGGGASVASAAAQVGLAPALQQSLAGIQGRYRTPSGQDRTVQIQFKQTDWRSL